MKNNKFPDNFMWGAATSSHQVEGGNDNDWTEWENAGHVRDNHKSGKAADHWNRFKEDFDILKELNLNSYRFSIEWSRIEPEKGKINLDAVEHYKTMLNELKKRNITPMVTLHHFTNPKWLKDWTHSENIRHFNDYVKNIVGLIGEGVEYWCTINEPDVYITLSYKMDLWPPGTKSSLAAYKAQKNIRRAHIRAYQTIHQIYRDKNWPTPKISMSFNLHNFEPDGKNVFNKFANKIAKYFTNDFTIRQTRKYLDYIGINYYFSHRVSIWDIKNSTDIKDPELDLPKNDLGWNMDPHGIYNVLMQTKKYGLPMIITESGIPDAKDEKREWFIVNHLKFVKQAIDNGADVFGYLHWSLLDNFEWHEGFHGCFGLVAIDYKTQERTIRKSARVYAKIVKENEIDEELIRNNP